ncbi:hypothetical protein ACFE04_030006 [Oxalis oulophora]
MESYKILEEEEELSEPVSPTGQYFNSSVLSISVVGVLESEIPIDDSSTFTLLQNVFLPINPRFSSIMVRDENGKSIWKKVEVNPNDHIKVPKFPPGLSRESYDTYFNEYLSKVAHQKLSLTKPLWEIHVMKYPTLNCEGSLIFKLHHALGDGFSLMGALLSCLKRADDPSLPLTFPPLHFGANFNKEKNIFRALHSRVCLLWNTLSDFGFSFLKSSVLEDDRTAIRSGDVGVEFKPIEITTMVFSLDKIKQIKTKLGVFPIPTKHEAFKNQQLTINDVIAGIIFLGNRLYMKEDSNKESTALVLLNTRIIDGYKTVQDMVKPKSDSSWGNQFGFLHVSLPKLTYDNNINNNGNKVNDYNPLEFVWKAQEIIKRQKTSLAVPLTGRLLEAFRKFRGPEATAKYIHSTLKNSSMTISNMIGPLEKLALEQHPCKGMYFMVVGVPQSLTITMVSYVGKLRVAIGTEKGFIDSQKFKTCIVDAYDSILSAANEIP